MLVVQVEAVRAPRLANFVFGLVNLHQRFAAPGVAAHRVDCQERVLGNQARRREGVNLRTMVRKRVQIE